MLRDGQVELHAIGLTRVERSDLLSVDVPPELWVALLAASSRAWYCLCRLPVEGVVPLPIPRTTPEVNEKWESDATSRPALAVGTAR